jgi:hypothetical protein
VRFDDGTPATQFFSWRGSYDELTLHESYGEWNGGGYDHAPPVTVAELLKKAREADGGTFEGWKGGDFTMGRHTPVWADAPGDYNCRAIVGVAVEGGEFVLGTIDISEYR